MSLQMYCYDKLYVPVLPDHDQDTSTHKTYKESKMLILLYASSEIPHISLQLLILCFISILVILRRSVCEQEENTRKIKTILNSTSLKL